MPVHTKRWDDPRGESDGYRLLITRYLPRGLKKQDYTWDAWQQELGPSKELHAAAYAKKGFPISGDVYCARYLSEMRKQAAVIGELAKRVLAGETITLLCSSACVRESRCHRSLLKELIEAEMARMRAAVPSIPSAT